MVTPEFTRKSPRAHHRAVARARLARTRRRAQPDALRGELFHFIRKLQLTLAVVIAAVKALERQAAEHDEDIAMVLQRHVCDAIGLEIDKWNALLGIQGKETPRPGA